MKKEIHGRALVIGGTGMLKEVSLWLANQGYITSVIGRNQNKLNTLANENPLIITLPLDYMDSKALKEEIKNNIELHGAFDKIVAWIHHDSEIIIDIIHQEIKRMSSRSYQLYHVLGSRSNIDEIKKQVDQKITCKYYQVQLGFKIENGASRWLTNEEISSGVIESIEQNRDVLVGQVKPWELRP